MFTQAATWPLCKQKVNNYFPNVKCVNRAATKCNAHFSRKQTLILPPTNSELAVKIADIEASLATEVAARKKLEQQYKEIDEMCKAKASDDDGRRLATDAAAAAGCGGGAPAPSKSSVTNPATSPSPDIWTLGLIAGIVFCSLLA